MSKDGGWCIVDKVVDLRVSVSFHVLLYFCYKGGHVWVPRCLLVASFLGKLPSCRIAVSCLGKGKHLTRD
jgi:hypothetical protein